MKIQTKILTLSAIVGALALQQASAGVVGMDLGTANPPATLGGYTMNPYDPGSIGGTTQAGMVNGNGTGGWATWGQSYTGNVYYHIGTGAVTLTLGGAVGAVYFYEEPNVFADYFMTATDSSGATVTTLINGFHGSSGVGFYETVVGDYLTSISVTCTDQSGFAIGEFGLDDGSLVGSVPDAGSSMGLLGMALVGLAGVRRYLKA